VWDDGPGWSRHPTQRARRGLECRLIVTWNSSTKEFQYLATNLPPERYSDYEVAKAYRLRWQMELLFKEWKSYANLHAFDTQNPAIVEGLIWAAISAAALKRFLAHTAQVVAGVETSTRKVAMCAVHFLHDILRALISEIENRFLDTFARAIDYLAGNARRAHPKRDRQRGRTPRRSGQWPHERHLWIDDRHGVYRAWGWRALVRPDSRGEDRHEITLPLAADRSGAGVARGKHAA